MPAKEHLGPRVTTAAKRFLTTYWPNANFGSQWILEYFPHLYEDTIQELKGKFRPNELLTILHAGEYLTSAPSVSGRVISLCLEDNPMPGEISGMPRDVELDGLLEKLKALSAYQRTVLEIWAQGYWFSPAKVSKNEWISRLV